MSKNVSCEVIKMRRRPIHRLHPQSLCKSVLVVATVLLAGCADRTPDPATLGQIVFVSDRGGSKNIYTMDADGSNVRQLTRANAVDWAPIWSPDGSQIAFYSDRDGDENIYVMNADGSDLRKLTTSELDDLNPDWSPDGERLVYARRDNSTRRENRYSISFVNSDGSNPYCLKDTYQNNPQPKWSPDGARIAFVNDGILVMDLNGTNITRLTTQENNQSGHYFPAWSPDGTKIAFSIRRAVPQMDSDMTFLVGPAYVSDIHVVKADGSGSSRLLVQTDGYHSDTSPCWSPDGQWIAYASQRGLGTRTTNDIYVFNTRRSVETRLTRGAGGFTGLPNWGRAALTDSR